MFVSSDVRMVFKSAKLTTAEDDKGVKHRMAECQLVIDEFRRELAAELGEDIAGHFFTPAGALRPELSTITIDPRVVRQRMLVRDVPDMPANEITQVDMLAFTVAKQRDEKSGKEWLKATIKIRFDFAPRAHREWIAKYFGMAQGFTFEPEQEALPFDGVTSMEITVLNPSTGKHEPVATMEEAATRIVKGMRRADSASA